MTHAATAEEASLRAGAADTGYYGLPVIHRAHWQWHIVLYFFLGGISGVSAALAAAGQLFGGKHGARLATVATFVSFATLLPCPLLLILDLGRPRRFLNMLRVFRPSSPMSVGSWGLSAFGASLTASTALHLTVFRVTHRHQRLRAGLDGMARIVTPVAGAFGLLVAGYTGTLLAATAVPLWSRRPALLGPLFLTSAAASGTATLAAVVALAPQPDREVEHSLRRLELIATLAEGTALTAWIYALGPTARPLMRGRLAPLVRHGVAGAGIAVPLLINAISGALPWSTRRPLTLLSSALTLFGGWSLRYAIVTGGRESADDPQATFELTG